MNISNFMQWFIQQFINIGTSMLGKLDQIILVGNVSLMDFTITIVILGAFISIIVTAPQLGVAKREIAKRDRAARREESRWNTNW